MIVGTIDIKVYTEIIEMKYFQQVSTVVNKKLDLYGFKYEHDERWFETLYYYVIWKIEFEQFLYLDSIYNALVSTLYKYYRNWDFEITITFKELGE